MSNLADFLTRERVVFLNSNTKEEAITRLILKLRPRYAVSGHNHLFAVEEFDGITCVRLGQTGGTGFAHLLEL